MKRIHPITQYIDSDNHFQIQYIHLCQDCLKIYDLNDIRFIQAAEMKQFIYCYCLYSKYKLDR